MATVYADRGFISMNGVEITDVENITVRQSDGTKYVPVMTRNGRHKGVVKGNRDINVSLGTAVQNKLGTAKLENLDYEGQDVALTFEHGGDRYTLLGLHFVDVDQSAPGVGSEGKKTFNFLATDIVDQVGNSTLFPTSLTNQA